MGEAIGMASLATSRRGRIRWDRLGRVALLGVLGVIVLLYVSPTKRWFEQSATASHQQAELDALEADRAVLRERLRALRAPGAVEREARRLGMVAPGERAYVVEGLRTGPRRSR